MPKKLTTKNCAEVEQFPTFAFLCEIPLNRIIVTKVGHWYYILEKREKIKVGRLYADRRSSSIAGLAPLIYLGNAYDKYLDPNTEVFDTMLSVGQVLPDDEKYAVLTDVLNEQEFLSYLKDRNFSIVGNARSTTCCPVANFLENKGYYAEYVRAIQIIVSDKEGKKFFVRPSLNFMKFIGNCDKLETETQLLGFQCLNIWEHNHG